MEIPKSLCRSLPECGRAIVSATVMAPAGPKELPLRPPLSAAHGSPPPFWPNNGQPF